MKTKYIFIATLASCLLWNCDDAVKDWADPTDTTPPAPLSNISFENRAGGVKFTFDLPEESDLLGAKAIYRFHDNGEILEAYSSAFVDTLVLNGFPDTRKRNVELYAVDKSMNLSAPVIIEIEPETPPIILVHESMEYGPDFGGVRVAWKNEHGAALAMDLYREVDGEWELYESHYDSRKDGFHNFRGMESVSTNFRIIMRDRWYNYADSVVFNTTPIVEMYIPGKNLLTGTNLYQRYQWESPTSGKNIYRGDITNTGPATATQWGSICDNDINGQGNYLMADDNYLSKFTTPAGITPESMGGEKTTTLFPVYLTVDISKPTRLSRFEWYNRYRAAGGNPANNPFVCPFPLKFEVWGSLTAPKEPAEIGDGSYLANWKYWTAWDLTGISETGFKGNDKWKEDWMLLGIYELNLESGAKHNGDPLTTNEANLLNAGLNWDIKPECTGMPVQYIRFVFHEFSDRRGHLQVREIKFFGNYAE